MPLKLKKRIDSISHPPFLSELQHQSTQDIQAFIKKFMQPQSGLLSCVQPLIAQIALLYEAVDTQKTFESVSNDYIKALVETVPVASVFFDVKLKIFCLSPSWHAWFSYSFDLPLEKVKSVVEGVSFPEILREINAPPILLASLENALNGENTYDELVEFWSPDGQRRAFRFECFPWYDKKGVICGVMMFAEDKTQCRQVRDAFKKLREANEMLENFSLIFSHDLIQPLRQISNFMNILQVHLEKNSQADSFIEMSFQKIFKVIENAEKLCREIVFYCQHGDFAINPQPTNFEEVLNKTLKLCVDSTQSSFINKLKNPIILHINPTCLFQLLQNLLANAVKHSCPVSPLITLSGEEVSEGLFRFDLHNIGNCADQKVTQNAFDPFTSSHKDGAGLGLMICKKIVDAYKGKISMRSSPKEGTVVSFTLPLYEKKQISAN